MEPVVEGCSILQVDKPHALEDYACKWCGKPIAKGKLHFKVVWKDRRSGPTDKMETDRVCIDCWVAE